MIVSFSIGDPSLKVINTLKRQADNIEFHSYPDLQSLVKEAMMRHISFDRIVFSTALFMNPQGKLIDEDEIEGELRVLNEFIKNYSDNTSIVMITTGGNDISCELFSKMFDSPMYTPVIMPKATPKNLLELATEDIMKLKTKYYVLDVSKDKTIVSSSVKEETPEPVKAESQKPEPEKKKKGGFFSGLMGGKKKSPEVVKPEPVETKVAEEVSKVEEIVAENVGNFSSGPRSVFGGFGGEMATDGSAVQNNSQKNLFESQTSPSPEGSESITGGFSDGSEEDDMLSLGEMGAEHTDTGFLDEDEEEADAELQAYLKSQEESPEEPAPEESVGGDLIAKGTPVRSWATSSESEEVSARREETPIETEERELVGHTGEMERRLVREERKVESPKTSIDLILGMHGSGSTSAIINEAMDLTQNKGAKVLIIDLDYRENGILSFIDTEAFYSRGYSRGLIRRRVYVEDGVGILSNGYGVHISAAGLLALLRSGVVRSYDEVLIDCPIECMDVISKEVLKLCNILVFTNTDRSDLLSTTLGLTNREYCSLEVERKVMKHCIVDCPEGKSLDKEDILYVKNNCLFANGCWLDNYK